MQPGRLIPFSRLNGFVNMAIDEFMIAWQGRSGRPVVRIYAWDPPSITIGRYQPDDCVHRAACRVCGVDIVRRITGGGAIYHDREINYSIACGEGHLGCHGLSVSESFRRLNRSILDLYAGLGLTAIYAKDEPGAMGPARRSAFCFSGGEEYDVVIGGRKIGGNAQRRREGTIFQHGSIPLSIDNEKISALFTAEIVAEKYMALNEAAGREIEGREIGDRLLAAIKKALDLPFVEEKLTDAEKEEIDCIMKGRYLFDVWNREGRTEEDAEKTAMAR
ncbi:MAG: lipoate--protein ligase family protein [Chrysiogenales bacterium]|nr:MAG: lipoate--protein ligase family protein [Chrysiogenales bacterium]